MKIELDVKDIVRNHSVQLLANFDSIMFKKWGEIYNGENRTNGWRAMQHLLCEAMSCTHPIDLRKHNPKLNPEAPLNETP
jgi:hypothetical protein